MKGFATRAVHAPSSGKDPYGALRMPIYDNVAFEHENSASIEQTFAGRKPAYVYTRIANPTVQDFEQRLQSLSGGLAVLALSSGMAAISNTIMTLAEAGANIVTTRKLFGNTLSLLEKPFSLGAFRCVMCPCPTLARLSGPSTGGRGLFFSRA